MATGLGFCPSCGTPRTAAEQKFCPTCGTVLAAIAGPDAVPTPPPAPPVEAAPPPSPPAWGAQTQMGVPPSPPAYPPPAYPPPAYPMTAPVPAAQPKSGISPAVLLLGLLLIVAVAGGAYLYSNQNSKGPGTSGGPPASGPVSSASLGGNASNIPAGNGLSGAANNFSNITSYKFSMTLAGGEFGSMLSALGSGTSGDTPFTLSGTVTVKPQKAADITMGGFHMVEVGGFDYLDMTGTGTFSKTAATSSSLADSFSPATIFSGLVGSSSSGGYAKVGSGSKNGVAADDYQASTAALAAYAATQGITGATWSSDVWIAQNGGYPVSMAILAVASDQTIPYEIKFDVTNVNDPANKVTAPTTVLPGA
jgi:hypothetical protein